MKLKNRLLTREFQRREAKREKKMKNPRFFEEEECERERERVGENEKEILNASFSFLIYRAKDKDQSKIWKSCNYQKTPIFFNGITIMGL